MSIKVAVRVRPFNQREKNLNSKLCVDMVGNTTVLTNDGKDEYQKERNFMFDYSFWSHDGFSEMSSGLLVAKTARYIDQKKVFSLLGEGLLENAWQGYHCTLFAYGQTGSGKSYSVMGYKPNVGIVPMACERIFERIDEENNNRDPTDQDQQYTTYQITVGMIEVYNEKVQDLLQSVSSREPQGLKIRESQTLGFYAEGQKKMPVRNFKEIEERIEQGSKNRSIGATLMNSHSSRAHTIISIELKQIITQGKGKKIKYSVINLVDLAGSEKVAKTGSTGDRLVEATNINKSLSTLGKVISTLADKSSGQFKNRQVPYRDSTLTKILKNALGGNSKTIMICAISPAIDNYDETLSTLRYADQAKRIQNKATINEEASDILAKQLQQENLRLRDKILLLEEQMKNGTLSNQPQMSPELLQQMKELQEQLEANRLLQDEEKKSYEEKIRDLEKEKFEQSKKDSYNVDQSQPHISNLNEDTQLNNQVLFSINQDMVKLGRKKDPNLEIDIAINGLGIKPHHCNIYKRDGKFYIAPNPNDPSTGEHLYLNGQKVFKEKQVMHNDRLILGQNATFLIKLPGQEQRQSPGLKDNQLTWEFAHDEYLEQFKMFQEQEQKNLQEKMQNDLQQNNQLEYEVKVLEMQVQYEDKITKLKKKYERRILKVKERCLKWKEDGSDQDQENNSSDDDTDFFEDEEIIDPMDPQYEERKQEQIERIKKRIAARAERRRKRKEKRRIRGLGAELNGDEEILSKKNGVLLTKDENGNIKDQKGNQVDQDIYGNIVDKKGNEFTIDQNGNIVDKNGNIIGRLIDEKGNIIDKDGNVTGQIIDINGNIIDKDGVVIGQMIDYNGNVINKDGNIIDANGHIMDKEGQIIDKNGQPTGQRVDNNGNIIDKNGDIIGSMRDKNGNLIDKLGNILDRNGNRIDVNGNVIGKDNYIMDKDGNIIDKDGNKTGERVDLQGNILDKDGKIIAVMRDHNGLIINKFGQTLDNKGNPIDKNGNSLDSKGNIICQDGQIMDKNGNILDKKGKATGQTVDKNGNILDKSGKVIGQMKNKDGYIINKYGDILDQNGNKIDVNGNIIDQNGNIIGIDDEFRQLKKKQTLKKIKDEEEDKNLKPNQNISDSDEDSDNEKSKKKSKKNKKNQNAEDDGGYSSDEAYLDPKDPNYAKKKKLRDLNRLKKLLTNKNVTELLKGDKQLQKILEEEGFIVGGKNEKKKKKKIQKGLTEQELRERWINRLFLQLYPRVETLNLIAEEMNRDIKFMVIQDQLDDYCVRVQNMENRSFYHWHLGTVINQTNFIQDVFEEYQATEELPVYEDRDQDDPFWYLEETDYEPERFRVEDYLDELRDKEEIDSSDDENNKKNKKQNNQIIAPGLLTIQKIDSYCQIFILLNVILSIFIYAQFDSFFIDSSKYSGSSIDLTGRDFIGGIIYTIIELILIIAIVCYSFYENVENLIFKRHSIYQYTYRFVAFLQAVFMLIFMFLISDDISSSKYNILKVFTLLIFIFNLICGIILLIQSFSLCNQRSGKIQNEDSCKKQQQQQIKNENNNINKDYIQIRQVPSQAQQTQIQHKDQKKDQIQIQVNSQKINSDSQKHQKYHNDDSKKSFNASPIRNHRKQSNFSQKSNYLAGQRPQSKQSRLETNNLLLVNQDNSNSISNSNSNSNNLVMKKNSSISSNINQKKTSTQSNFRPSQLQYDSKDLMKSQVDDDARLAQQLQAEYNQQSKQSTNGYQQHTNYQAINNNLQYYEIQDFQNNDLSSQPAQSRNQKSRNGNTGSKNEIMNKKNHLDYNQSNNNLQNRQQNEPQKMKQATEQRNQKSVSSHSNNNASINNQNQQQTNDLNEISINSQMNLVDKSKNGISHDFNDEKRYKAQDQI